MASRLLTDLHPFVLRRVELWLHDCERERLDILVYCTHRSADEQAMWYRHNRRYVVIEAAWDKLHRWGLTEYADVLKRCPSQPGMKGKKKTNAMPGLSFHQVHTLEGHSGAFAVDFVPVKMGKCQWENPKAFNHAGILAENRGLTWSGRWKKFKETCHVQWDNGGALNILKLAQGKYE